MIIFEIAQYCFAVVTGVLLGYQMMLSFSALKGRKIEDFKTDRQRKFAIVIPAHNEEKVIAKTLYSLGALVYPKNLYDLIVVADNCTDNTAKIAGNLGATVLERTNKEKRGKGYALRWGFDRILQGDKKYDAVIVFDSDSLVSGNYLEVMNYYISQGSRVIQSSDLVLPQSGAWSSEATRIGFLLYNYVKPIGRKVLGYDMGLRGNGMCFTTDILKEVPWQAWSLTEDVEYGLILMLENIRIDFAPEADVWAEMPAKPKNAESQRKRWEMGRYPIVQKYAPKLLIAAIRQKSSRYIDTLIDLVTPPLVNLLLFVLVMGFLNIILWLFGWSTINFLLIWIGVALLGVLHLFVGLYAAGADKNIYKSILYIPMYAFWKLKLYVKAFTGGTERHWVKTKREH
ncbi:MAG TPA: glycosyltransferase family 2 protein [Balneolaceae bacterium]